jgi:hypothetical protein
LPSERLMFMCSGLKSPAPCLLVFALKPGAKGRSASVFGQLPPPGAALRVKSLVRVTAAFPLHGVITVEAWFGPQAPGLVSTARAPSSKLSVKALKGACGRPFGILTPPIPSTSRPSKVVVRRPVDGSALTLPSSRTKTP